MARFTVKVLVRNNYPEYRPLEELSCQQVIGRFNADSEHDARRQALEQAWASDLLVSSIVSVKPIKPRKKPPKQ